MPSAIAPYENQLIGSFLLALGYHGGRRKFPHPIRANLLQQTPLDRRFGDLMAGAERFVVIEFKRFDHQKALAQEAEKWDLGGFAAWVGANLDLAKRASSYHFLAAPSSEANDLVVAWSYPDFLLSAAVGDGKLLGQRIAASDLIEELYEPKRYGGEPDEVLKKYLPAISRFRKAKPKITPGGRSIAQGDFSILGIANDGKNGLRFLEDDSLSMVAEHVRRRELERQSQERGRDRDRGLER